jgi:hypothetical protein
MKNGSKKHSKKYTKNIRGGRLIEQLNSPISSTFRSENIKSESSDIIPKVTEFKDGEVTMCAPTKRYDNKSCFTLESLKAMCNAYNNYFSRTNKKFTEIEIKDDKKHLLKELSKRLNNVCNDQVCWIKQKFINNIKDAQIKEDLTQFTFRPSGPKDQYQWLSTIDIKNAVNIYRKKYPNFLFLGAVPIDFDDLPSLGISNLDFDELKKDGVHQIGIIFNLDEHYKSGSHWVAMYSDLTNGQLYYFDSYGVDPEKRIVKLMDRIEKYFVKNKIDVDRRINKVRHQYEDSECGVYSTTFILRLLKGDSFDQITKNVISDNVVNQCRNILFRGTPDIGGQNNECKRLLY